MKRGRVPDCSFITSQLSTNRGSSLSYLTSQPSICLSFIPLSSQVLIIYVLEKSIDVNNRRLLHLGLSSWPPQCIEPQKWKPLEGEVRRLKHVGGEVRQINIVPSLILIPFFYMLPVRVLFQVPVGDYVLVIPIYLETVKIWHLVFLKKKQKQSWGQVV